MMEDNISGALYGMAIGDALGMPSELWSRERVKNFFGYIDTFLDGPKENETALYFKAGQFTDDTSQALVLLDVLFENGFTHDEKNVANKLMAWAYRYDAFNKNILGPSSKAALTAIKDGQNPKPFTDKSLTNGAAMRIAPIGCLFSPDEKKEMIDCIVGLTKVTHSTDVAFGGASMVAVAVSAAIAGYSWEDIMREVSIIYPLAAEKGAQTFSASLPERLRLALQLADDYANDENQFSLKIYNLIGTGTMLSESVPAALAIAYYTKDPKRCALFCANLGGDTDTIGAMATAICGAKQGYKSLPPTWIDTVEKNNEQNLETYIQKIMDLKNNSQSR